MIIKQFRDKSGRLVTAEMIESMADEAERGYDLDKLEVRPVGRPSLSEAGESPRVQYRIGAATYTRAKRRAHREGVPTISALSRALLQAYADGTLQLPAAGPAATKKAVPKPKRAR